MALPHSRNIYLYPARSQFQSGAPCRGSSTCTDTCIQMILEYYKERTYTLSQIRYAAQRKTSYNEHPCTGINYVEVLNALNSFGVNHYRLATNPTASWVGAQAKNYGPVIVGVHYGSYPNSRTACGGTNKAELGGRNDCGFYGAHAVLVLGKGAHYDKTGKYMHVHAYIRDPDHGSPARPSIPKYDKITLSQLERAMNNLVPKTAFRHKYALYPTRRKTL